MTGPAPTRVPGLLGKLIAVVRAEFRSDVLVFDPQDPVFGGPACAVPGCVRTARGQGLCAGHHQRWWRREGKPDLDLFIATTDPKIAGRFGKALAADVVPRYECQVSLVSLAPQLRLEVQFLLQCRHDERLVQTPVSTATRMVRLTSR